MSWYKDGRYAEGDWWSWRKGMGGEYDEDTLYSHMKFEK